MSHRIAYSPPAPVVILPRKGATATRRKAVTDEQGVTCAEPTCDAPWTELDHITPLALGGADEPANWQGLCQPCHAVKTRWDVGRIAKAKRLAGVTCNGPKRPIPDRGFDTRLSRTFSGQGGEVGLVDQARLRR